MYFTQLDIGGLTFVTENKVTNETVVEFLERHEPAHVYTNARIEGHRITCSIMGENCYSVNWRTTETPIFIPQDN